MESTATQPLLYRVEEAARLLGVSRSKAYDMATRGELPVVRIRSSLRVPAKALEVWIEERATTPRT